MEIIIIFICFFVSLMATWMTTQKWIRKALEIGLIGWDMNKPGKPKVAEMGGICVVFGFVLGSLVYIGIITFLDESRGQVQLLAVLCTVLMTCIVGMMDDLLGWKRGLRQWQKPIFILFASIPMVVINSGHSTMSIPFLGSVDWGILYPLLIVPIGIVGASNAYNMVAGYNGLEAGMGVIILSVLGYVALLIGEDDVLVLALCMVGALLAFLYFNWYPAKVFPGDTLTYSVGAFVACLAILGDMEKIAVILFVPYGVDFVIQARGRFNKEAFAMVDKDGSLELSFKEIFHLTHMAIIVLNRVKGKTYERDVVLFMWGIELAAVGLIFLYNWL
jgi:UDP-N-acetylglucosamine--dolichyl-phosphate N-acetylglucosaminephosphotransferase